MKLLSTFCPLWFIPLCFGFQSPINSSLINGSNHLRELIENQSNHSNLNLKDPNDTILPSRYHQIRGGIRNSLIKFEKEQKGRVVFLGGSITYNHGWRDSIVQYLEHRFPTTDFDWIEAGIPSMGSTPAAFRLYRDVCSRGPVDLLFEEAAVNDAANGRSDTEQIRALEGIFRHLRNNNPKVDIVLMHFVDPDKINSYRQGQIPRVILNHERVAEQYNVSSIDLAKEVTDRIDAGEFTWKDDFIDLHPSPFGQGVYARSMIKFLEQCWSEPLSADEQLTTYQLPKPLDTNSYDQGKLIEIQTVNPKKGWSLIDNWTPKDHQPTRPNYVNVPMMVGDTPHKVLKFPFEGTAVGIAVAAGPDAGVIAYKIDQGQWIKKDLFTPWSSGIHLPWYYTLAVGLKSGNHVLSIRLTGEKNPKSTGHACRIRYFYVDK